MSYKLFTMATVRIISDTPIPLRLYKDMAFAPTSLKNIPALLLAVWNRPGWRGKLIMIWLIVGIAYLLAFPTLLVRILS